MSGNSADQEQKKAFACAHEDELCLIVYKVLIYMIMALDLA